MDDLFDRGKKDSRQEQGRSPEQNQAEECTPESEEEITPKEVVSYAAAIMVDLEEALSAVKWCRESLQENPRNAFAYYILIHALLTTGQSPSKLKTASLSTQLKRVGWEPRQPIYGNWFRKLEVIKEAPLPKISAIVVASRFSRPTIEVLRELENQIQGKGEIILAQSGLDEEEISSLRPFTHKIIHLEANAGAFLCFNIAALFANAPILLFLDGGGMPCSSFIQKHLEIHVELQPFSVQGRVQWIANETDNSHPGNLGPNRTTTPVVAEFNSSYSAPTFFQAGGWGDYILLGSAGLKLSLRLLELAKVRSKQVYEPEALLNYRLDESGQNYAHPSELREQSNRILLAHEPRIDHLLSWWFEKETTIEQFIHYSTRLFKEGQLTEARLTIDQALALHPESPLVHAQKKFIERSIEGLKNIGATNNPIRAIDFAANAYSALLMGDRGISTEWFINSLEELTIRDHKEAWISAFERLFDFVNETKSFSVSPVTGDKEENEAPKLVFVRGSGWSGSSAITDYLREFDRVFSPAPQEYEYTFFAGCNTLLESLEDLDKYRQSLVSLFFIHIYGLFAPSSFGEATIFRNTAKYRQACDPECYAKNTLLLVSQLCRENIPEQELIQSCLAFVSNVLSSVKGADQSDYILIDNPHGCEPFYSNNTIHIQCFRDPRAQFANRNIEFKSGPMTPEQFVAQYRYSRESSAELKELNPNYISIEFEDFVSNQDVRNGLAKRLGLNLTQRERHRFFKPWESQQTISSFCRVYPNQSELEEIENELKDYCRNLSEFLPSSPP